METNQKGNIILKSVPDSNVLQDTVRYLAAGAAKNVPREKLIEKIGKAPCILFKNIPEEVGRKVVSDLQKIGAPADFETLPEPAEPEEQSTEESDSSGQDSNLQGDLVIRSIPMSKNKDDVLWYLSKIIKNDSPKKIAARLKKFPATVFKNIPENYGRRIAADLVKIGAMAKFEIPQEHQEQHVEKEEFFGYSRERILERIFEDARSNMKRFLIMAVIVIIISSLTGVSLLPTLFGSDREIMYQTRYVTTLPNFNGVKYRVALYQIKLGNTGEEDIDDIRVKLSRLPETKALQICWSVLNLTADNPRSGDPSLKVICDGNRSAGCFETEVFSWHTAYQLMVSSFMRSLPEFLDKIYIPWRYEYKDPCQKISKTAEQRAFRIRKMPNGALVLIELAFYDSPEGLNPDDFEKVELEIIAEDVKISKSDPQASVFVRMLESIVDIF